MQQDHRQHTVATRRKAIDRLFQLRLTKIGQTRKKTRKWIRKLVDAQVAAFKAEPQITNEERGRRANAERRRKLDARIKAGEEKTRAFKASKPLFE